MKIIKINYLTYYFLVLYFLCGYIKLGLIVFLIIIVHEFGHVCAAKINKYKIKEVTIYPFGGITKVESDINSDIKKDLFLSINGIFFQILLFFLFYKLFNVHFISQNTYKTFFDYNNYILLFNLLPIIPLDGSKISEIFLTYFFSYKSSLKFNIFLSIITLFLFLFYNFYYSINNFMIIFFLFFKIIEYKKSINEYFNKFLLERYLNNYNFKHLKNCKTVDLTKLKKNTQFYFFKKYCWVSEKNILKNYFYKND